MKPLLATLLLALLTLGHAYAQSWPRNPTTGKVEFRGTLPWPAGVKTEAQRQALVRRWYLAKLTDSTPAEIEAQAATNQTNGLLTYAGLPTVSLLRNGVGDSAQFLSYFVLLTPTPTKLIVKFTQLDLQQAVAVEDGKDSPLEQVLSHPTAAQQEALAALRKRLTVALASW